jgi:Xaa-Pro aminopeptidase
MSAVLKPAAAAESRLRDPISTAELERRWAATRAAMKAAGLDAIVVQSKEDWMNGYTRWFMDQPATNAYPKSLVFPLEGLMISCDVGMFDQDADLDGNDPSNRGVGRRVFVPSFNGAVDYNGKYDAGLIAKEIRKAGYRRIGLVCANGMYHGFVEGLREGLEGLELVDATDLVDNIKAIKSPEEIERIKATAAMQDKLWQMLLGYVKPGMKEHEVSAWFQYQGQLMGSNQGLFFTTAGTKLPLPPMNRYQQSREIQKGDVVSILIENNGPGGFYTELGRTMVMGKAPQWLKDACAENVENQRFCLDMLVPGAKCSDIFARQNEYMVNRGHSKERRILAHGQGYEMVERPLLRHDENMLVRENMHIAVHPMGSGFTGIDNYLIGPRGPGECLHKTPKQIFELS